MISKDTVVEISYEIHDTGGELLDQTEPGNPMVYLHGHGNLMPALEKQLDGKSSGEKLKVSLEPTEAFGELNPDSKQRVSKKLFKQFGRIKAGDVVPLNTDNGQRIVTIVKVGHSMVDVDTNHPYAGKSVTFALEILRERPGSDEEIAHGHAHGFDGTSGHDH